MCRKGSHNALCKPRASKYPAALNPSHSPPPQKKDKSTMK